MKKLLPLIIIITLFGIECYAACPGSVCSLDDCNRTTVDVAINTTATYGDTIVLPECDVAWLTYLQTTTDGITIQGTGELGTKITSADGSFILSSGGDNVTISNIYFVGDQSTGSTTILFIYGDGWRINNCKVESKVSGTKLIGIYARGVTADIYPTGLIDNNTFIDTRILTYGSSGTIDSQSAVWAEPLDPGGSRAVYIENNTFALSSVGNVIDGSCGAVVVARYNDITSTGTGYVFETHAVQGPDNRAFKWWEFYLNKITGVSEKYSPIHLIGGTGVVYGNVLYGSWQSEVIYLTSRRAYDDAGIGLCDGNVTGWDGNVVDPTYGNTGWPCRDQIGRGPDAVLWEDDPPGEYTQTSVPTYIWDNKNTSNEDLTVTVTSDGSANHIKLDRDYYVGTPKPAYTSYTCPHPLTGLTGTCDSAIAGRAGYNIAGSGTALKQSLSGGSLGGGAMR